MPSSEVDLFTNSNEKKTGLLLCLLCIFRIISNTYLPEFVNILLEVKAHWPVLNVSLMLYSVVIFNSKLDLIVYETYT